MMDCRECAENLTAFLDGELNASDSEQVRRHVNSCASCAEELRTLRETVSFVESHRRELEPRPGSWNLVRARISSEGVRAPARFFGFGRWQTAAAALAVCAVLAAGYVQYQQIQKRNLDGYIAQYLRERAARGAAQIARWDAAANTKIEIPYANNPFTEIRATLTDNPFRSEDR